MDDSPILRLRDENDTARAAHAIAETLDALISQQRRLSLYLHGPLGAGKTTLVRGILRCLGHQGRVKSPSFTLVEPYNLSRYWLYHFDLYRFSDPAEWQDAGFDEIARSPGLMLVEWPERGEGVLDLPDLELWLSHDASGAAPEPGPAADGHGSRDGEGHGDGAGDQENGEGNDEGNEEAAAMTARLLRIHARTDAGELCLTRLIGHPEIRELMTPRSRPPHDDAC